MENNLQFLGVTIKNHPLFGEEIVFNTLTNQRVMSDNIETLTHLYDNKYRNNVIALVGKNASGKTTLMSLVNGILVLLLDNVSISQTHLKELLFGHDPIEFVTTFFVNGMLIHDRIVFDKDEKNQWCISDEQIYTRNTKKSDTKTSVFEFKQSDLYMNRADLGETTLSLLASDDSIFRNITSKFATQNVLSMLMFTDINMYLPSRDIKAEILEYLDSSIEYLKTDFNDDENQITYRLKFKHNEKEFIADNFTSIEKYLSSGTVRGLMFYSAILYALEDGGIIFIDEIENHFNHAIARTFIEFFKDRDVNRNNATLIFSTHYSEFLDEIERGDQIYVAKQEKNISLTRYSDVKDIRSDLSKSEVFMSDDLGGTSPKYTAYMKLRNATIHVVEGES